MSLPDLMQELIPEEGPRKSLFKLVGIRGGESAAKPDDRIYIAPLIFTLAPLLNTLVSLFWHPTSDHPLHFGLPAQMPGWKLFVGIVLVGVGAGLVLLSKEEAEAAPKPAPATSAPAPAQVPS